MVHCSDGLGVGVNVAAIAKRCCGDGGSATTRTPTIAAREEERNFMVEIGTLVDSGIYGSVNVGLPCDDDSMENEYCLSCGAGRRLSRQVRNKKCPMVPGIYMRKSIEEFNVGKVNIFNS